MLTCYSPWSRACEDRDDGEYDALTALAEGQQPMLYHAIPDPTALLYPKP